jgi:glycosyltransferase involved in cell wall biosynthesis
MPSLVSLVMTVYNREDYLPQALDSILIQTYPHWHLTIWDDGSTDSSPNIAREYARIDPRIRFIPAPHTGRQHALRAAIAATTRDYLVSPSWSGNPTKANRYLAFVDSDDLLAPIEVEMY